MRIKCELQQYLPLAVLKLVALPTQAQRYGQRKLQQYLPLAVLKLLFTVTLTFFILVATVLTACGIETLQIHGVYLFECPDVLQQYLPLAVLKLTWS